MQGVCLPKPWLPTAAPTAASQYEVEQALIGLTSDKTGVPVEEIQLHSSFTNDLGLD
jgi:hypothetical protein